MSYWHLLHASAAMSIRFVSDSCSAQPRSHAPFSEFRQRHDPAAAEDRAVSSNATSATHASNGWTKPEVCCIPSAGRLAPSPRPGQDAPSKNLGSSSWRRNFKLAFIVDWMNQI